MATRHGGAEELEDIYLRLDELEPLEFETLSYRPRRSLFFYPIGVFLVIYLIYHIIMAARSLFHGKEEQAHV